MPDNPITPAVNELLSFAEKGIIPSTLLTLEEYRSHPRRLTGFVEGEPADQCLVNTVLRQCATMACALAQFLADNGVPMTHDFTQKNVTKAFDDVIQKKVDAILHDTIEPTLKEFGERIERYAAARDSVPLGAIFPWGLGEDQIPKNFHICDGTHGTIDLRDKFVLGAGKKYSKGDSAGSETIDVDTKQTALTNETMPRHKHTVPGSDDAFMVEEWPYGAPTGHQGYIGGQDRSAYRVYSSPEGGGKGHSHRLVGDIMPPYYALLYIQKISLY